MTTLDVLSAGALTTVQDLGRPGFASTGVGHSGALDPRSLSLANRLVGNTNEAAGLEMTFGGLRVRLSRRVEVAVTGCVAPVQINGRPAGRNAVLVLECGDVLAVGPPTAGVRSYLAVRGGITVPKILGSCSMTCCPVSGPGRPGWRLAAHRRRDGGISPARTGARRRLSCLHPQAESHSRSATRLVLQ